MAPPHKRPKSEKPVAVSCSSEEDDDDQKVSKKQKNKKNEIHDTTSAIPIILDVQDLVQKGIFLGNYEGFVIRCYSKRKLMDPNPFGPYYLEGENVTGWHLEAAEFAFDWNKKNCPGGSDVKLKMVTKMSCSSICEPIYYLTFTVVDVDGNENTLQAMVLQFGIPRQFLLGMLRDASHDKVLAIIRFKEAPTEVVAQKLEDVLKKVGEKVLFKT